MINRPLVGRQITLKLTTERLLNWPAFSQLSRQFTFFSDNRPTTSAIEARLLELEGVRSVTRRTGRAERDEHAEPVSSSEIEVTVKAGYDRAAVRAEIDEVIASIPGITTCGTWPVNGSEKPRSKSIRRAAVFTVTTASPASGAPSGPLEPIRP